MAARSLRILTVAVLALALSPFLVLSDALADPNMPASWAAYKSRFLKPDGRIVDTGNKDISHTEGQGWSMMLAYVNNDRETFDKIWTWTDKNMSRDDVRLFSWRWDPNSDPHITDKNNATDGDLMIAWSLMLAGQRWDNPGYLETSEKIREAIATNLIVEFAGRTLLLPGIDGFQQEKFVVVNPSYQIFPAFEAFHTVDPKGQWKALIAQSLTLIKDARFGEYGLVPDWLSVSAEGRLAPAKEWPPRFGYNAVRVPLYLVWGNVETPSRLEPFIDFWSSYCGPTPPPAWVDLHSAATAKYPASRGMRAVEALTIRPSLLENAILPDDSDYYSSALFMLSILVAGDPAGQGRTDLRPSCPIDIKEHFDRPDTAVEPGGEPRRANCADEAAGDETAPGACPASSDGSTPPPGNPAAPAASENSGEASPAAATSEAED